MDSKANERTLYRAQAVVRAYARALEAEEQDRLYENIADDFAVTAKMILGDSTSKDFYELADALDKIHSEVWFKNQQREVRSLGSISQDDFTNARECYLRLSPVSIGIPGAVKILRV